MNLQLPKAAPPTLPATLARASMRYTLALFEHDGHSVGLLVDATLLRQAVSWSLA